MRNISFALTTKQIIDRTKTVTRRNGWLFLKSGEILQAVEKCQGLKKGEKVKRLCKIQIKSVRRERLSDISISDVRREGFPGRSCEWFCNFYKEKNKIKEENPVVTRIEFKYVEEINEIRKRLRYY